jgi:predicted Rossmann fold nucleotide-binding protein DprA/Smf involved in DNA uptake
MILAIVGSVLLSSGSQEARAIEIINLALSLNPEKVVSGGALGVDSLAEGLSELAGIPFKKFLPGNNRWEPDGFKARNILVAEACTHLLCIRTRQSKTYGSGWTADYAESLGRQVARKII